ncbi:MAG TPA: YihY/virulence factor BrkB family protein [Gaiellaceae bacterium]|nr:YihY/virulence factor BrkB family protein [Gaiellaceae bacterium]
MSSATEAARTGRPPSGPERLSARDWLDAFKRSGKEFLADDCMGLSQQVAFSSLLAFFPAMVFLIASLDLVGAFDALQEFLAPIAPTSVTEIIRQLQRDTGSGSPVLLALGIFGALWAGSGAMSSLVKAVNRAYDQVETRPIWTVRGISLVLVLASGTVLAGMLLLIVLGGKLGDAIAAKAGFGDAFQWFWNLARWPLAFVVILLLFALIYFLAPNREQRSWRWITPGALVGAFGWLALSGLFALYTSFSDSYSRTYGALASGIVLLLWLNYSAWAVLFGAELNSELDRQAEVRAAGGENAGLVKPARRGPD